MDTNIKNVLDDLENLLYVTSFYNKDNKVKKNRKKLKECIKNIKKEKYDKVFTEYDEGE